MSRFLMYSYGAARITREIPQQAEYVDTVAVDETHRCRVLREGKELWAVPVMVWTGGSAL